ncbi:MAG: YfiR/HmsC family protein [Cognaticolwellia sp.]
MLLLVSIGLVVGGQTWAQTASLDYEKAMLLGKFAKYVSWPAEARQRKFVIGVYDDSEKFEYLSSFFANKGVKGKDIEVRAINTINDAKNVNILYIASEYPTTLRAAATRIITGSHVLIMTENSKYLAKTTVDISFDEQGSNISFKVIEPNLVDGKLTMPELSYFLDDEKNGEVLTVSPSFAQKNQHSTQLLALQKQVAQQEAEMNQLNKTLSVTKANLAKSSSASQQQSERLEAAQQQSAKQSQDLKAKDSQLQRLQKQVQTQEKQLKMSKQDWQIADEAKIKEQEQAITDLNDELEKQKKITNNATTKISKMAKDNKSLSSFQMLFYVFVVIAIIALLIALMMWKKAKNAESQSTPASDSEGDALLPVREGQLIKSENLAALGYMATDITYAAGVSLEDLQAQLESAGDTKNAATLKPVVTLLENFNLIAADQDDTDVQSFDVIAYMQKMMMLYDFEFNQSDITYSYSGEKELAIKSVPSYIALVLLNIVNNSLKHGFDNDGNGKVALKVEKGAKGGATITYSDDGKGMSKDVLSQVFTPFFTTRSERGYVGVGMSTTYDLVKNKLSGDIKIDSQKGKGTTVTITLP